MREMDGTKHSFLQYEREPLTALNDLVLMDRCVVNDNDFLPADRGGGFQHATNHTRSDVQTTRV